MRDTERREQRGAGGPVSASRRPGSVSGQTAPSGASSRGSNVLQLRPVFIKKKCNTKYVWLNACNTENKIFQLSIFKLKPVYKLF